MRQTLRVTVNDMTLVPLRHGGGFEDLTVDGIELRVSDELRKRTQDELLGEAIHDAMARAVRVAKVMGLEAADVRIESIGTGRMSGPSVRLLRSPPGCERCRAREVRDGGALGFGRDLGRDAGSHDAVRIRP